MSISMLFRRKMPEKHSVFAIVWSLLSFFLPHVTSQDGQFIIKHVQDPLNDWSSRCINNATLSLFLTLRMGQSDGEVLVISGNYATFPNCTIDFYSVQGSTTVFTFEFPDTHTYNTNLICDGIYIVLFENHNRDEIYDVCKEVNATAKLYTSISSTEPLVSVSISTTRYFQPFKLTATTARKIKPGEKCDPNTEVECIRQSTLEVLQLCMTAEIQCDGHLNCGALNEFDESEMLCSEPSQNILWIMVVFFITLVSVVTFFLLRFLRRRVPRVGTNFFVFNEDEDNRLNLTTVYSQSEVVERGVRLASSSYVFKTSDVKLSPQEARESIYLPSQDSEVEMRSELPNQNQKSGLKNSEKKLKPANATVTEVSNTEPPFGNEGRKTHFNISPAFVDVIPDFDESPPKDLVFQAESAPRSILVHVHDQKVLPESSTQKIEDVEPISIVKRKRTLKDVVSSKDLLNFHRMKSHQKDEPSTSKRPRSDSDSD